jgi:hypothetical protein
MNRQHSAPLFRWIATRWTGVRITDLRVQQLLMFDTATSELKLINAETGSATTLSAPLNVPTGGRSLAFNHWTSTAMLLCPLPGPSCALYTYDLALNQWQLRYGLASSDALLVRLR